MKAFRSSLAELWPLAWPLALVQLNSNLTGAIDTALAGRIDPTTLGATGLGAALYVALSVVAMGAGLGIDPLVSQAFGRQRSAEARRAMWQGIYVALLTSLPLLCGAIWLCGNLMALGVDPDLAEGAQRYLWGRLPALPVYGVIGALRSYLQAARLIRPILISALAMNAVNVVADWVLLFGDEGLIAFNLPVVGLRALGTFGLGLASALASLVQLAILVLAIRHVPHAAAGPLANVRYMAPASGAGPAACEGSATAATFATRARGAPLRPWRWHPPTVRRVVALGLPAAAQMLAEVGIFTVVSLMMGNMGAHAAAAHQSALTLVSLSFSLCVGVAAATAVHVGRAVGAQQPQAVRMAGLSGLTLGCSVMLVSAAAMWACPAALLRLFIDDGEVHLAATRLLAIAGVFQLVDGAQCVAAGALRGTGNTRFAFYANVTAHWGVGLPVGLLLAHKFGFGAEGLWWGLTVGLLVVAVDLCLRFWSVTAYVVPLAADEG